MTNTEYVGSIMTATAVFLLAPFAILFIVAAIIHDRYSA